jgi:hypothetical protein
VALLGAGLIAGFTAPVLAAPDVPPLHEILPPEVPWDGASRALVVSADDPWVTPCEQSGLTRTPRYDETISWLNRLCDATRQLNMVSLGRSPEGRGMWMVVAATDGASTPEALHTNGRPTLFAQAGIHSGEIDGKDAGLMLLRDMTVRGTKNELLEGANLLFVPILSVDAHERFTEWSRINQRGPTEAGWRTTARNLNLNRDYAKLDTTEMRQLIRALNAWRPDLYVDLHVTDGADYQYDITWGANGTNGLSPATAQWLQSRFDPAVTRDLNAMGHIPGPLVFAIDGTNIENGVHHWTASPRFSTGYGDARHLPTVLVENHSLKPYGQRVLGTYVFLESCMRTLAREAEALRAAVQSDVARRPGEIALDWEENEQEPALVLDFLGIESRVRLSPISGAPWAEYSGKKVALRVPQPQDTGPLHVTPRPSAYWIPSAWPGVIERLQVHGVDMERIDTPREVDVQMDRVLEWTLDPAPFEGHVRVTPTRVDSEPRRERFAPGSVRVSTDQPLGELVMLLLEPYSPDSFFQWGFFLEILSRAEYAESYVLEPLAERMLARDPDLRAEFERKLSADATFATDPRARLNWFYVRTPWFDSRWRLYPVAREVDG